MTKLFLRLFLIVATPTSAVVVQPHGEPAALGVQRTPQPNGGGGDEPPRPEITLPIIAFHSSACLPSFAEDLVEEEVRTRLSPLLPRAHVRGQCANDIEYIGVWEAEPATNAESTAYQRGLFSPGLIALEGQDSFGAYISRTFMWTISQVAWNELPRRWNLEGTPDPSGSAHLSGMRLSLQEPAEIRRTVDGWVDADNWFDPNFEITVTDTLAIASGEVICTTDTDTSVDTDLATDILLGLVDVLELIIRVNLFEIPDPDFEVVEGAAGCLAAALLPNELQIADGDSVTIEYTHVEVRSSGNGDGLFVGGTLAL